VIKINECVGMPEFAANLFPCHHFSGMFEHQRQQPERLRLQSDPVAVLVELAGAQIQLKTVEGDALKLGRGGLHFDGLGDE
jgi:hypothetical protein